MLFSACALSLSALGNSYTVVADRARLGHPVPLIAPLTWEFSSHLLMWLLVPLDRWLARFPLLRAQWWRSLPAHLLATVPFSLVHVVGMILLRKLAYWSAGFHYDFGPFVDNWIYEYRKDFGSYWVMLSVLLGFRVYGLWLDSREAGPPRP